MVFESLGVDEFGSLYVKPLLDRQSRLAGTQSIRAEALCLKVFRFTDVLAGASASGQMINVRDTGPAVHAARMSDVRAEFGKRYPTDDTDPKKAKNTLTDQFKNGLKKALDRDYATERRNDVEWIWCTGRQLIVVQLTPKVN